MLCARNGCNQEAKERGRYCCDECRRSQWRDDHRDQYNDQQRRLRAKSEKAAAAKDWQARRAAIIEKYGVGRHA